jgi:hypothetical protein
MAITNKIKFSLQEKTTESSMGGTDWTIQGTILDAGHMSADSEYLMISWVNCTSPGSNDGATKLAFADGGGDIEGSAHERHDTNNSGMYVPYIGQFTAPSPPEDIGIYRKRLYGSSSEQTNYGQAFIINLSYSGESGGLVSGTDFSSSQSFAESSTTTNGTILEHSVSNNSGSQLVLATARVYDSTDEVLLGLYINDVLMSSGSRYTQDAADMKSVVFAAAYNMDNADTVKIKNIDPQTTTSNYKYIFTLNLDNAPATQATGQLSNWTNYGSSGSWGACHVDGNYAGDGNTTSFCIGMGRQTVTGAESGRMASISLRNNTSGEWLLFGDRPSGSYSPLYYPATNPGTDGGQYETSVIVGVGLIGNSDEIEMQTL